MRLENTSRIFSCLDRRRSCSLKWAIKFDTGCFVCLLLIPQTFDRLAAFHLEVSQTIIFSAVHLSAALFLASRFKYCSRGLPTAIFFRILLLQGCLLQALYA